MRYRKVGDCHIISTTWFGGLIHVGHHNLYQCIIGFIGAIRLHRKEMDE